MPIDVQPRLFSDLSAFPRTRYQGSKLKLLPWIWEHIKELGFSTCLDAFGGTGSVAYLLKCQEKAVTYNDILRSNYVVGKALIENSKVRLSSDEIEDLMRRHPGIEYPDFVARTFKTIYFKDDENVWIDIVRKNISLLKDEYKRALAYFALFQACIIKRPYNLFHRANLYIRTSNIKRNFGNKTTWDRSFDDHFRCFAEEASEAVFDNGLECAALNKDVLDLNPNFDLVYVDPPYMNSRGVGPDYFAFYHFLEGLVDYDNWSLRIDRSKKHLPLKSDRKCPWLDRKRVLNSFDLLFEKFQRSVLVISYRTDGTPTPQKLISLLHRHGRRIRDFANRRYKYVLSSNGDSQESVIVAT